LLFVLVVIVNYSTPFDGLALFLHGSTSPEKKKPQRLTKSPDELLFAGSKHLAFSCKWPTVFLCYAISQKLEDPLWRTH
jgi:hypothetical protein